jgi:hypothetical protein
MSLTKLSLGGNIPAQGEFSQWHPGWGRENRLNFFTVHGLFRLKQLNSSVMEASTLHWACAGKKWRLFVMVSASYSSLLIWEWFFFPYAVIFPFTERKCLCSFLPQDIFSEEHLIIYWKNIIMAACGTVTGILLCIHRSFPLHFQEYQRFFPLNGREYFLFFSVSWIQGRDKIPRLQFWGAFRATKYCILWN